MTYDALLLVSFGGPEGAAEVEPFLRNVTSGRPIPAERLAEVAERYQAVGGVSPVNDHCRRLLAALRTWSAASGRVLPGCDLPWYWGNRNWHPLLTDTVATMARDGVRRALAFVTSGYGSYSACRQYCDDIAKARAAAGEAAPVIDKIRHFGDHPGFVLPFADGVSGALLESARERGSGATAAANRLVFTAHAIPVAMNVASGPDGGRYLAQLRETAELIAKTAAPGTPWDLVWQSRSGPPAVPWLEPDIGEHLVRLAEAGVSNVVVCPIGFVFDNFEVLWDLDRVAAATARRLGLGFTRVATPGTDPRFVDMIAELVAERVDPTSPRRRLGTLPVWDQCPEGCCEVVPRLTTTSGLQHDPIDG